MTEPLTGWLVSWPDGKPYAVIFSGTEKEARHWIASVFFVKPDKRWTCKEVHIVPRVSDPPGAGERLAELQKLGRALQGAIDDEKRIDDPDSDDALDRAIGARKRQCVDALLRLAVAPDIVTAEPASKLAEPDPMRDEVKFLWREDFLLCGGLTLGYVEEGKHFQSRPWRYQTSVSGMLEISHCFSGLAAARSALLAAVTAALKGDPPCP